MQVKLVRMRIEPTRTDVGAAVLQRAMAPAVLRQPGALRVWWMTDAATGSMLSVTWWTDREALEQARAPLGALGSALLEEVGAVLSGSETYAEDDPAPPDLPRMVGDRCRVFWIEAPPGRAHVREAALVHAVRAEPGCPPGAVACCYLADDATGNGVGFVEWGRGPGVAVGRPTRHERRRMQRGLGCRVDAVQDFDTVAWADAEPGLTRWGGSVEPSFDGRRERGAVSMHG